jgi:hypothetical protein
MKMKRDFISGYMSAVSDLGNEGDRRGANWSAAYNYLKKAVERFEIIGEGLVENLRYRGGMCVDAADEIERLQAGLTKISEDDPTGKYGRWARETLRGDGQEAVEK